MPKLALQIVPTYLSDLFPDHERLLCLLAPSDSYYQRQAATTALLDKLRRRMPITQLLELVRRLLAKRMRHSKLHRAAEQHDLGGCATLSSVVREFGLGLLPDGISHRALLVMQNLERCAMAPLSATPRSSSYLRYTCISALVAFLRISCLSHSVIS